jgi:carbon storage regulator
MLILSRKLGESIVIDGNILVTVMRVDGDVVKLGIAAPATVPVHRKEVYEEIQRSNEQALTKQSTPLPKLAARKIAPPKTNLATPSALRPVSSDSKRD